jgi:sulfatase-like protein
VISLRRTVTETLKHALAWILGHREQPSFFFLHLYEPHAPYEPPEPFKSRYPDPYDGEIAAADTVVGELVRSLKASGSMIPIIIVTSDHGEGLWTAVLRLPPRRRHKKPTRKPWHLSAKTGGDPVSAEGCFLGRLVRTRSVARLRQRVAGAPEPPRIRADETAHFCRGGRHG